MRIKLKIVETNKYVYKLKDDAKRLYILNIEFLDIEETLQIGDFIYINEELLNPKHDAYSTSFTFGNLDNKYGRANLSIDDIDIIKVVKHEKEIYLKRLYG